MAARHRTPEAEPPAGSTAVDPVQSFLTHQQFVVVVVNAAAALALLYSAPGTSPSLNFLLDTGIPLRAWAGGWALVVVILTIGAFGPPVQQYAHVIAFVLWAMLATGAVIGLITATTTSPSGSLIQAGLVAGMAGLHLAGLVFRRRLAEAER